MNEVFSYFLSWLCIYSEMSKQLFLHLLQAAFRRSQADIEQFVWSNHRPWIPRPLLSMHVRMGDKACEMTVVGFESYMQLAGRIRQHFPNLDSIWLSTEMQVSSYHYFSLLLSSCGWQLDIVEKFNRKTLIVLWVFWTHIPQIFNIWYLPSKSSFFFFYVPPKIF